MPTPGAATRRDCTARETAFAVAYAACLNGAEAVRTAGYTCKNPRRLATYLLQRERVQALVAERTRQQLAKIDLDAVKVKRELARIAFADPAACFAPDGRPLLVHEMPAEVRAAIRSVRVICRDGVPVAATVEFWSKVDALKVAAQHLNLLAPKELTVTHRFPHAQLTDAELRQRLLESAHAIEAEPVVDVTPAPTPEETSA